MAIAQMTAAAVTVDNFTRAESDLNFGFTVDRGGLGKFFHYRELTPVEMHEVVRPNRDTLYSVGVFDLDAGPATITVPEAGERFMSMQAINQDHYVNAVTYGAGSRTFTRQGVGTRYLLVAFRVLVNPSDPSDFQRVHALQDSIVVSQRSPGRFEVPEWDAASRKKIREALLVLGTAVPDTRRMFGKREETDPVRHLIGTAIGWGGNPEKDAFYLTVTPEKNDGAIIHQLRVGTVPVDAFWSITVYNARGYFERNRWGAYSLNNLSAKKGSDGSVTVQFGGDPGKTSNVLPIVKGWNYTVRLYRPRPEVLNGSWVFPAAQPLG